MYGVFCLTTFSCKTAKLFVSYFFHWSTKCECTIANEDVWAAYSMLAAYKGAILVGYISHTTNTTYRSRRWVFCHRDAVWACSVAVERAQLWTGPVAAAPSPLPGQTSLLHLWRIFSLWAHSDPSAPHVGPAEGTHSHSPPHHNGMRTGLQEFAPCPREVVATAICPLLPLSRHRKLLHVCVCPLPWGTSQRLLPSRIHHPEQHKGQHLRSSKYKHVL